MTESIIWKINKKKDKKKEERKKKRSIASSRLMIQKMLTKLPLYLDKIKLITEEKIKYTQQLKFIIHQEENQVFNLVERIKHDFNPSIIF